MRLTSSLLWQLIGLCAAPSVPHDLVYSIVQTESAGYVYALSGSYQNSHYSLLPIEISEQQYAISVAEASLAHNVNISLGLMQINSWHIQRMGATAKSVFDPCNNVLIGSAILQESIARLCSDEMTHQCRQAVLREYNTGRSEVSDAGQRYVARVENVLCTLE